MARTLVFAGFTFSGYKFKYTECFFKKKLRKKIFGDEQFHSQQAEEPPKEAFGILIQFWVLACPQLETF